MEGLARGRRGRQVVALDPYRDLGRSGSSGGGDAPISIAPPPPAFELVGSSGVGVGSAGSAVVTNTDVLGSSRTEYPSIVEVRKRSN